MKMVNFPWLCKRLPEGTMKNHRVFDLTSMLDDLMGLFYQIWGYHEEMM